MSTRFYEVKMRYYLTKRSQKFKFLAFEIINVKVILLYRIIPGKVSRNRMPNDPAKGDFTASVVINLDILLTMF